MRVQQNARLRAKARARARETARRAYTEILRTVVTASEETRRRLSAGSRASLSSSCSVVSSTAQTRADTRVETFVQFARVCTFFVRPCCSIYRRVVVGVVVLYHLHPLSVNAVPAVRTYFWLVARIWARCPLLCILCVEIGVVVVWRFVCGDSIALPQLRHRRCRRRCWLKSIIIIIINIVHLVYRVYR